MSLWGYHNKPIWFETAEASDKGWINPETSEILVSIDQFLNKRDDGEVDTDNLLYTEDGFYFLINIDKDYLVF